MGFPLGDWIDDHAACRYDLGRSGMRGSIRLPRLPVRGNLEVDLPELRMRAGRLSGVTADRVFLTHGASEGNALALLYLARRWTTRSSRVPRCWVQPPEYPPIFDVARAVGFRVSFRPGPHEVRALSRPNNPTGTSADLEQVRAWPETSPSILVDETFREFTAARSLQRSRIPGLWTVGTFTKAYGGDALRVGFVIPPPEETESFRRLHGMFLDELPPASAAGALTLLRHRRTILAESQRLLARNLRILQNALPGVPSLTAPVWFDRGEGKLDGEQLARACLRASVLVCPGGFFGEPGGVRLCLTRRSFRRDLAHYLAVRERYLC